MDGGGASSKARAAGATSKGTAAGVTSKGMAVGVASKGAVAGAASKGAVVGSTCSIRGRAGAASQPGRRSFLSIPHATSSPGVVAALLPHGLDPAQRGLDLVWGGEIRHGAAWIQICANPAMVIAMTNSGWVGWVRGWACRSCHGFFFFIFY